MKKYASFLFFIFFCFYAVNIHGNNQPVEKRIDSVKSILIKTKELRKQIVLLNQLSEFESERKENKSALNYALKAKVIAHKENDRIGMANSLLNAGIAQRQMEDFDAAIKSLEQGLTYARLAKKLETESEIYDNIGHIHNTRNEKDKALEFYFKALKINRDLENENAIAVSCSNIAEINGWKTNYIESIKYYEEALTIFKKSDDNWRIAFTAASLGSQYSALSKNNEALENFFIALKYYQKSNNLEGVSWAYVLIGNTYTKTDDWKKALKYFEKSLEISESLGRRADIKNITASIGSFYMLNNDYEIGLKHFFKVLKMAEEDNDLFWLSMIHNMIGKAKAKQNKLNEALSHFKTSVKISEEISNYRGIYGSKRQMAFIYFDQQKYQEAKENIKESITYHLKTKEKNPLFDDYRLLSLIEEKTGDYKSALEHHKLHKTYHDSLKLDDASKEVMKYEFNQKEAEIKVRQEEELNRKSLVANTTYGILGGIILFSGLGLYSYRIRNKKLTLEKQNLDLRRREAELAKGTEEFKSRFMSNISHEFRTPLTLINGHLEILKKEGDTKNLKRFNEMEYSGQRLLQLINQLLDLTKIETGKYNLYYKKGNLLNEAKNYVQAFHSLAEQRGIGLDVTITDAAEEKLAQKDFTYSSEALASIFNNLISNALKFTPKEGKVSCVIDFKSDNLYIVVRDNGPGIPEKDLPHIFERFYQVQQVEKPIYEGSGIGLAIVKELAQFHGGDVSVENNEDGGCTFTVWLSEGASISEMESNPVSVGSLVESTNEVLQERNTDNEEKPLLLVVEDQRELRKFIVENLGDQYRFLEAENGKEGVDLALEHLPEIIISDVMMPEMTGFQLTNLLKNNEITSHIPIVLLTAKSEFKDKMEGLEIGADDYLTKPFSISELELRIKNRLHQQEMLRKKFKGGLLSPESDAAELNLIDRNFIEKLDTIVMNHIENEIDVTLLATEIGLSNSQLTRKLKVLIGTTPANFIKNIQLNHALELLRKGHTVAEASWKSGFTEPAYFSKVFKKHFGFLPSDKHKF